MNITIQKGAKSIGELCGFPSDAEFCLDFKRKIEEYCAEIGADQNHIRDVAIHNEPRFGEVKRVSYDPPGYDILFYQAIPLFLYKDNPDNTRFAESVIKHELYHCKDMDLIGTMLDLREIEHDSHNIDELSTNLGYHQWGEFYAHYNSCAIYESCYKSIAELGDLYERAAKLTGGADDWITLYETIAHPHIRNAVILAANNSRLHSKKVQNCIAEFAAAHESSGEYLKRVQSVFEEKYRNYPNWVSYDVFKELGEILLDM